MTDDYKCSVCGIDVTSGLMAAMCPFRERCEFWPDDEDSQRFLDSLGMRYKAPDIPAAGIPTFPRHCESGQQDAPSD